MTAEFNWWLLIVGLVVGATLVWLVLADSSRRDSEIANEELPMEAAWIAATMRDAGDSIEPEVTERVLRLHRLYLGSLPPDDLDDADDRVDTESAADPALTGDAFDEPTASRGGLSSTGAADGAFAVGDRSEPPAAGSWDANLPPDEAAAEPGATPRRAPRKTAG